ncbi:glutamate--tRNA ligase [Patescibacteria group bacterium]|nr:glutamate--tRNA ligase [Patescibacteria group bacterium]MBU1673589.1 glutamate--tRNA ligase [Patescibacteria group bacterium]MBU1964049.1 glutamate--tRNA ligase [Patescibacteria group bacterium]
MEKVVTRFAPSPTGNLHIGGARTALFSYLWAKKNKGKFILRIEDTDQDRYVESAENSIIKGLKWLGMDWDDGPYHQSERLDLYNAAAKKMVEEGNAYYCFCSQDRLKEMREKQVANKQAPKYDGLCKSLSPEEVEEKLKNKEKHVIRLKVPEQGSVEFHDEVRGDIKIDCKDIDDQVLVKSDGFPTYHLAVVVDDNDMGVNWVIRGEEWLPSVPKHVLIYKALGYELPNFAHLSLFINKGGGKLSKREGATSLLNYRDQGYLPEAVVNFISFLGWNPKDTREIFSMKELEQEFDLKNVNKANPIFDTDKLDYLNGLYIRNFSLDEFEKVALPFMERDIKSDLMADKGYVKSVLALEQERVKKLDEVGKYTKLFFTPDDQLRYDPELLVWKKSTPEEAKDNLEKIIEYFKTIDEQQWNRGDLEENTINWIKEQGLKNGDVLWPVRAALSGEKASPSPFELAEVLGKKRSLIRLEKAKSSLQKG